LKTLREREHFPGLYFYGATISTTLGSEPGDSIIVLSGPVRENFMLHLKLLGGFPLCLSVSTGAAVQGSGLLTLLCTSSEPKLAILGNSLLILVSNLKNYRVLINFICTVIKKQLTNIIQPLEYKKILLLLTLCGLKEGETIRPPGGMQS
jgi:hypothetical protein